jgi:ferric-dicitrate binding protein FerR (iron transport regulator)
MTTRRQALGLALVAAARPTAAFAANTDTGPLTGLVAYEQAVAAGYTAALQKAPLNKRDRPTLESFRRQVEESAAALRKALQAAGGKAPAPPDPATTPPPQDPSRRGWLRALVSGEEASVAGYYEALQSLIDERHLNGSAAFMAQSGRRLVVLRDLAGEPLLPRAFETGLA